MALPSSSSLQESSSRKASPMLSFSELRIQSWPKFMRGTELARFRLQIRSAVAGNSNKPLVIEDVQGGSAAGRGSPKGKDPEGLFHVSLVMKLQGRMQGVQVLQIGKDPIFLWKSEGVLLGWNHDEFDGARGHFQSMEKPIYHFHGNLYVQSIHRCPMMFSVWLRLTLPKAPLDKVLEQFGNTCKSSEAGSIVAVFGPWDCCLAVAEGAKSAGCHHESLG
nr:alcohol dehydrogenase class-3 [Ipomoea batatas]